ncbi:MAG: Holliday junction resolvase RuvX [Terriglobales bacterium]
MALARARTMALDLGQRRIGVAVSDELGMTAQGLETIQRQRLSQDLQALAKLAREWGAARWLLGLPRQMNGEEGTQAQAARRFGAALLRHTHLPLEYWDERLTTVEAQRLLRAAGSSLGQRQRAVDKMAAVILLQAYLEHERNKEVSAPLIVEE